MSVLVVAEHDNESIKSSTLSTIAAAQQLGDVTVLVAGHHAQTAAEAASQITGVQTVLHADAEYYAKPLAEEIAGAVVSVAHDYSHVLFPASTFGKNLMPRVAALLDVAPVSEIIEVVSDNTFKRPIYAGNAFATVECNEKIKVLTVRGTAFDAVAADGGSAEIKTVDAAPAMNVSSFVSQELTESERPDLTDADVVVSGGRGLGSGENFELIEKLADKLGAAVGASRAAVDSGYVPNDYQVGQTGKIVAPKLYIAVGISGAIQHMAGMKDSKVIVAINKDEEAPIFQFADYGLVGDLFEILPELTDAL